MADIISWDIFIQRIIKITGLDIAINKGDSMAPHFHFMGKGASNFRHTTAIANHFCQICQ